MTDWPKIRLLEGRLAWHRGKANYRRKQLAKWQKAGQTAHHWHAIHAKQGNAAAAAKNQKQIEQARREIRKWKPLLDEETHEVYRLEKAINALRPKTREYKAGGWVAPGESFWMQRSDQGQDFEIPLYHHVIAPGDGYVVGYSSDRPFPNGFGNPYAVVKITTGRFAGNDWYLGHANEPIVRPGQHFKAGQPLARLNHGLNNGRGWIEVGHWPPGSMSEGYRWRHLFEPIWK